MSAPAILFFDADCAFCDSRVRWIAERDPELRFQFAPLQGETAARLLAGTTLSADLNTMVLRQPDGTLLTRSDAALAVARGLAAPWPWLSAPARLLPRPVRDAAYNLVARHRHQLTGTPAACAQPDPARYLP